MAKNQIACGDVIDYTAAATITSGDPVLMGDLLGVAQISGVSGDVIPVAIEGVYEIAKTNPQVQAIGVKLYWDAGTSTLTTTASTNKLAGYVARAAGSTDATVWCRLVG
jgi:predicted RecA/RadA family phage recombinase